MQYRLPVGARRKIYLSKLGRYRSRHSAGQSARCKAIQLRRERPARARRTNADKRRAVMAMLADPEWRIWNNSEIARRCAVDEITVRRIKGELSSTLPKIDDDGIRLVTRAGITYPQNTAGIGHARAATADGSAATSAFHLRIAFILTANSRSTIVASKLVSVQRSIFISSNNALRRLSIKGEIRCKTQRILQFYCACTSLLCGKYPQAQTQYGIVMF